MRALLDHVPLHERVIVIEQPAELKIAHPNAVRWKAVDAIPREVAVTPSQLLAAALRHRPDRIIMGEIRDACGYDLLQAMNTGHGGTLSTIHAKSAQNALNRLSDLALSARPNLNHSFVVRRLRKLSTSFCTAEGQPVYCLGESSPQRDGRPYRRRSRIRSQATARWRETITGVLQTVGSQKACASA